MLDPKYHDQHAAGVYRAIALRFYCRYVEMRPARWPAFSIQRCALRAGGFARRAKCDFRHRVSSPVRAASYRNRGDTDGCHQSNEPNKESTICDKELPFFVIVIPNSQIRCDDTDKE